jgi:uncharacterized protein
MPRRTNAVIIAGLAGWTAFRARRRVIAPLLKLPPARYNVGVRYNIRVPMPDGVSLATDHHYPLAEGDFPTILIRTPYGRGRSGSFSGLAESFKAQRFAERGYHVIIQDSRGRFDSEGVFEPFAHEAADGLATIEWIGQQPWFDGNLGMWGQSYLGYTQWAAAPDAPPYLKAIMPAITASQFYTVVYADGAYALNIGLRWAYLTEFIGKHRGWANWRTIPHTRKVLRGKLFEPAYQHLPISQADSVVAGKPMAPFQDTFTEHDRHAPRWKAIDHSDDVGRITIPVHLISGWYDAFQRELLADYEKLKQAGNVPYLTIGPWSHVDQRIYSAMFREGLAWFDAHLKGEMHKLRQKRVSVYVMGAREWRFFDSWPPPARETHYFLQPERWLYTEMPQKDLSFDTYRYDPADPTPSVGGTMIFPPCGPVDNAPLEMRSDVLNYTSSVLTRDVEVIGKVRLELYVRSSLAHTDFFGRLCDVHPDGRSINICDGLFRIEPDMENVEVQPDGSLKIVIDLWSTAHRFLTGHRIRLLVASGSHPRWSRNLGTGEPLGTGTLMNVAHQTVYHDRAHPSALVLPLV